MSTSLSKSEAGYITSALLASPDPVRADGRGLLDFRSIAVETSVAALANGSGRAVLGGTGSTNIGLGDPASEAIVAARLEVEDIDSSSGVGLTCSVTCTPSAYPQHTMPQLDDLSSDLSALLQQSLQSSANILAPQLIIIPKKKRWHLNLDAVIISDSGNILDTLVIAARAALWDLRVPRTRNLDFQRQTKRPTTDDAMEVDESKRDALGSAVKGSRVAKKPAGDFELEDYWDDGSPLKERESLPVCVTLNLLPPVHFLDAVTQEERAVPTHIHMTFSFPTADPADSILHNTRLVGPSEIPYTSIAPLIEAGEGYARRMNEALNIKLKGDDRQRAAFA
ncbi:hypothetical protein M407DRAFT_136783 [Tulasnella calospora MUT 4182]|uniref:Ribosomal RNA-processing protein 42 n=1 Tax=Tulasnella calospora MUT 4182 TaxID=1051891 RepID=A0A0C3PYQ2_9AGAM|nr:hypothetical protein M407DRAFT_136783 [Tulasnella calospora MUT 4182]